MIHKIDHFVITTAHEQECLAFYKALDFKLKDAGGRYELYTGDFKINVHLKGRELEPKAMHVQTGSQDFCLEVEGSLDVCKEQLLKAGIKFETGIVPRNGTKGPMQSVYMRDPDGNLVELCSYTLQTQS